MHKRTTTIIKNLGIDTEILDSNFSKKTLLKLKKLGLPEEAIKQIKFFENYPESVNKPESLKTNEQLLNSLIKKCKRSFVAFSKKQITLKVLFMNNTWTLFVEVYNKQVEKFHVVCKPYFDEWANKGLKAILIFKGDGKWSLKPIKEKNL